MFLEHLLKKRDEIGETMNVKKLGMFFLLPLIVFGLSGCAFFVVGAAGVLGGYTVTRDTIQGEYDANYSKAWKSALEVCSILGSVASRDTTKGVIEAAVDKAKVKVEITQITPEAIRIKVKARKGIFPRLGTAEKIFVKIVQQIME